MATHANNRYFITKRGMSEQEVSEEEYREALEAAGVRHSWSRTPLDSGFRANGVSGRIEYVDQSKELA